MLFWIDQTEEGNRDEGGVPWLDLQNEGAHIQLDEDSWQADQGDEDYPIVEVTTG